MIVYYTGSFWRQMFAALLIVTTAGCVAIGGDQRRQFAGGTLILPKGYNLREDRNWDTPVATGMIEDQRAIIRISYSCGSVFGVPSLPLGCADPASLRSRNYKVLWSKQSGVGKLRKVTTFAEDQRLREKELYIAFPNAGPSNFIATVKSSTETDEIERVVGTFEPKSPKRGN